MAKRSGQDTAARGLLRYLEAPDYRPLRQRELLHRLQLSDPERPPVRQLIRDLIAQGRIRKIRGGRLIATPTDGRVRGVLRRQREGYGIVVPEGGGEDLFVAPRHMGRAQSGDRVLARVVARGQEGRLHGVIIAVSDSPTTELTGLFTERGRAGMVQPFEPSLGEPVFVPAPFRMGALDLEAVRVGLVESGSQPGRRAAKVLERLGHIDRPGTDLLVVIRRFGLATEFPDEALEEAEALSGGGTDEVAQRERERFDGAPVVTIDGETARDFDDALCVVATPGGGFRLFVHIADVAHFVREGSALDREAQRRGTSVYFPHRVLPMLPERLSNDLCSLRPDEDRLVQSVIIDFDAQGNRRGVRFADGVIRSVARLTYTDTAAVIERRPASRALPRGVATMLRRADRLRARLEDRRRERGGIDFDLPEPQILLDVEGAMTGVHLEPRNRAHRMVEEFMLVANNSVAEHLEGRGAPCVFRTHDPPDPLKLEDLADFAKSLGLDTGFVGRAPKPTDIQRLMNQAADRPEFAFLGQIVLRSLKQARYCVDNAGHFGLALSSYCHFTSPIRRYPDLAVHRLLRACRRGRVDASTVDENPLRAIAESCSELERNAEAAERELLTWKKIAYIQSRVGESYEGVVTGVARFGVFVQLKESLVDGLLHVERLGEERFEFVERRFELLGTRSGRTFRMGDTLTVRVDRVDRVLRRVDFTLQEKGGGAGGRRARPRAERKPTAPSRAKPAGRPRKRGRPSARSRARPLV